MGKQRAAERTCVKITDHASDAKGLAQVGVIRMSEAEGQLPKLFSQG